MAELVRMPKLGFDMAEGTLVRWVAQEGQTIAKGMVLAEIETDKATVEVESAYDGVVVRHLVTQCTVVPVNTPIAVIGASGEEVNVGELTAASSPVAVPNSPPAGIVADISLPVSESQPQPITGELHASPLARRMAQERGMDIRLLRGSGPGGRIVKRDVEAYLAQPKIPAVSPAPLTGESAAPGEVAGLPAIQQSIPLTRLRAAIARRMVEATQQIPHFYITHEYDMAALMELRQKTNALLAEDEKLSVNDFIVKAVALALRQYPSLNASFDQVGQAIVQHPQVNIGVAVAMESGLLTVVNRNTDIKPLLQIASEMRQAISRARLGRVHPDDIEGSTFTVSNLGMYQVEQFTAIINPPESAILAVGAVRQVPVVVNGELKVGMRMKATLSVDHRVSDGAQGAQFLQSLGHFLEEPLLLFLR